MLKRTVHWSALVAALAVVLLIAAQSKSYQACRIKQAKTYQNEKKPQTFELTKTFFVCEGVTGDANGDLLTALGTIAIAAFTLTLWLSGREQGRLTRESIELAREEFLVANRPHLTVRNVHAIGANPGDSIAIKFEVINNGGAAAYIVGSSFEVHWVDRFSTFRNLRLPMVGEPPKNCIGEIRLIPSQVYRGIFEPDRTWQTHQFEETGNGENGFFWGGKILYRDIKGRQRRLGVYRRFDVESRRFRSAGDSEFEYDD